MAEKIVSPGVFTRENDLSFLSQGIGEIGAAIIGPFHKGPAFVPTVVNTQSEFEEIFGTPNGDFYTGYTVQNYLREAGVATVVRVGHIGGYTHARPLGIKLSGVGIKDDKIIGVLHGTNTLADADGNITTELFASTAIEAQPSASAFSISGSLLGTEISASVLPSAGNDLSDVFGESAFGAKKVFSFKYFENAATGFSNHLNNSGSQVSLVAL